MPNLTLQVGASADDAHERESDTSVDIANAFVFCRDHSTLAAYRYWPGLRWASGGLPPMGSTINICWFEINVGSTSYDDVDMEFYMELGAAPASFTVNPADISSRPRTVAFALWDADALGTGWVQSPSMVGPAQEVFNAFAATAVVIIGVPPAVHDDKELRWFTWDWNPALAARFFIDWTPPAGAHNLYTGGFIGANRMDRRPPN